MMYSALKYPALLIAHCFLQQTAANAQQIGDIEARVESLAEVLASPVCDDGIEENARREALRKFVPQHNKISSD